MAARSRRCSHPRGERVSTASSIDAAGQHLHPAWTCKLPPRRNAQGLGILGLGLRTPRSLPHRARRVVSNCFGGLEARRTPSPSAAPTTSRREGHTLLEEYLPLRTPITFIFTITQRRGTAPRSASSPPSKPASAGPHQHLHRARLFDTPPSHVVRRLTSTHLPHNSIIIELAELIQPCGLIQPCSSSRGRDMTSQGQHVTFVQ